MLIFKIFLILWLTGIIPVILSINYFPSKRILIETWIIYLSSIMFFSL